MYTCIHVYILVYMYTCIYASEACIYVYICICIYVSVDTCIYVYVCMHIWRFRLVVEDGAYLAGGGFGAEGRPDIHAYMSTYTYVHLYILRRGLGLRNSKQKKT